MGMKGVVGGPVAAKILFSDQFGAFPFICALGIQVCIVDPPARVPQSHTYVLIMHQLCYAMAL